jgi:hypothetical protein
LKKLSFLRANKLTIANESNVPVNMNKIGALDDETWEIVKEKLNQLFQSIV